MKICVVIPCFNVADTIGGLLRGLEKYSLDSIIIDDGSSDSTVEAAAKFKAAILKNSKNEGKGVSLRRGFNYALENGYAAVIAMDGDGQHACEDVRFFLDAYDKGDVIIGNRMGFPEAMPAIRRFTNRLMSRIISCLSRQEVPDSQSGFRMIKCGCLKKLKLKSKRFEIESEIILEAARAGCTISSIPIKSIYHCENTSQIKPFIDTLRFLKFILPYALFGVRR